MLASSLIAAGSEIAFSVGASFTELTVIETVALVLLRAPSLTRNVKLSAPLKFALGVYVKAPVSWSKLLIVPLLGLVTMANLSVSPSGSLPVKVPFSAVSSFVEGDCALAVGA